MATSSSASRDCHTSTRKPAGLASCKAAGAQGCDPGLHPVTGAQSQWTAGRVRVRVRVRRRATRPGRNGSVFRTALVRGSLNYRLVHNGHAYPLFYDTLFADLRHTLESANRRGAERRSSLWPSDRTGTGVKVTTQADLQHGVVIPSCCGVLLAFLGPGRWAGRPGSSITGLGETATPLAPSLADAKRRCQRIDAPRYGSPCWAARLAQMRPRSRRRGRGSHPAFSSAGTSGDRSECTSGFPAAE
jgi:hypothetical protein